MSVFISYRRATTRTLARALEEALRELKVPVFLDDSDILPGERYPDRLDREVAGCQLFVALVDAEYFGKRFHTEEDFVRRELETALRTERVVVPILIDDAPWPPGEISQAMRDQLSLRQARRFDSSAPNALGLAEEIAKAHRHYRPRDEPKWHTDGRVWAVAVGYLPLRLGETDFGFGASYQEPIVISAGRDCIRRMSLMSAARDRPSLKLHPENYCATSLVVEGTGRATRVVAGFADTSVAVWDLASAKVFRFTKGRPGPFVWATTFVWRGGDRQLFYADSRGGTNLWPVAPADPNHDNLPIFAVAPLSFEGRDAVVLATRQPLKPFGVGEILKVRDLETGDTLAQVRTEGPIRAVLTEIIDDNAFVVSAGDDGYLKAWDSRLELLRRSHRIQAGITALVDTGAFFVAGASDGTVRAFRRADLGFAGAARNEHQGEVTCLAQADLRGRTFIVSGGVDGAVRVFALETLLDAGA